MVSNSYGGSLSAGCVAAVSGHRKRQPRNRHFVDSTGAAAAPCVMNVTDGLGASYAIPYTTTTSSLGGVTIGGVTEYAMTNPSSHPEPIVAGPDGNLWVGDETHGTLDKITTSGVDTPYSAPNGPPFAIAAANDGDVWFLDASNALYQASPSGSITMHSALGVTGSLQGLVAGPDGNLWIVDQGDGEVLQVSMQAQTLNTYGFGGNTANGGIAVGNDGRVYVLDPGPPAIYAITPGGNTQTIDIGSGCTGPSQIANDASDGNLYVTCSTSNSILQVQTGGAQTNYPIGQGDAPRGLIAGPDGSVWFAAPGTNTIGRFNLSTDAFTHYAIPTSGAYPIDLALGSDGRIWFTEFSASKVGVLTP